MVESLLEDLKGALQITWLDEDHNLRRIIKRSMAYLNELAGAPLDFSKEGQAKTLLIERCRYLYNHAADEFEVNYHHELSRLILKTAITKAGGADGTASGSV